MDALTTVFAVLFMSSFGLFTGMPPLPEDPIIERIAPPDTLVYFSWAGAGKADPKSGNKTEQMLADEEVRVFLDGLGKRWKESALLDSLDKEEDPKKKEAAKAGLEFLGIVMTSPAAGFISDMTFKKKEPAEGEAAPDEGAPDFAPPGPVPGLPNFDLEPQFELASMSAGFIFNAGDRAETVQAMFDKAKDFAETSDKKWSEAKDVTIGGLPMKTAKSEDGFEVFWGRRGTYFFGAVGREAIESAVAGLTRQHGPPAWLTGMKQSIRVERPSYRWYVDAGRLLAMMEKQSKNEDFAKVVENSGLVHVHAISSVTGFDQVAMTTKTLYALEGDPQQYLTFLPNQPLTADDLKYIPADASWACAGQLDFAAVYKSLDNLEKLFPKEEPAAPGEEPADDAIAPAGPFGLPEKKLTPEQQAKLKQVAKEIAEAIGPTWSLHNAPSDGGFLFTGMTAVVDVKHDQKLRAALQNAVDTTKSMGVEVKQFDFRGQQVSYFRANIEESSYVSSAWCIVDGKLVWALYPQVIKSFLTRTEKDKTLADTPNVRAIVTGADPPLAMTYVDTEGFYMGLYKLFQVCIPFIDAGLKTAGVDYPAHEIPSAAVIRNYIQPSIMTVRRDERGIVTESQKSLPLGGGAWLMLAVFGGMSGAD